MIGVGGQHRAGAPDGFMIGYLQRNNPLLPLELNLAQSSEDTLPPVSLRPHQWRPEERARLARRLLLGRREHVVPPYGAARDRLSMSGSASAPKTWTCACGYLVTSLALAWPLLRPPVVKHHFVPSLRDTLRRSRGYGRGCARLYRKWPTMRPTIFPGPLLMLALLVGSGVLPVLFVVCASASVADVPQGTSARGDEQAARVPAGLLCAACPGGLRERRIPEGHVEVPALGAGARDARRDGGRKAGQKSVGSSAWQ